ncbi:MAG: radical SAM protein [Alphaproteobacteria bacterium]|nr:radical SAM protein [Alphaproteobacteria bacterium]
MTRAARTLEGEDWSAPRPIYAVWELTLKCDQACRHCGSRAGLARTQELSTQEAFEVGEALVDLGCRELTVIGGEAYLRPDLDEIVAFMADRGVRVTMQTGGRAVDCDMVRRLKRAGLSAIGVSIDGLPEVHDRLRGVPGGFRLATRALDAGREEGLLVSANTQINRLNMHQLPELCAELRGHGIVAWQVQLTVPMGRAADRPEWIVQPWEVLDIVETLADIQRAAAAEPRVKGRPPFNVFAGNNIGYFGPHELILRSRPGGQPTHWMGCRAGQQVIGIEADGTVKGCPSLPTAPYVGGNVRELSLAQIWAEAPELRFARDRTADELWGFCRTCYYADTCRGGCSFTAHSTLGRRGNQPFCWYRADQLRRKGLRERLVHAERAPGRPFDFGRFELVEEPWPTG